MAAERKSCALLVHGCVCVSEVKNTLTRAAFLYKRIEDLRYKAEAKHFGFYPVDTRETL